jgi:hypothetical protein
MKLNRVPVVSFARLFSTDRPEHNKSEDEKRQQFIYLFIKTEVFIKTHE